MDFRKFLEMISEAESTSEKDTKAEEAGKKVAKDIEDDEGHKGKDDNEAEEDGEEVTKDIEYDDKKSLKDWFELIDKNMLAEAEQIQLVPAKQNTQVIKQGDKPLGTVSNPALAAQIKGAIDKGQMSLAGHEIKEDDVELDEVSQDLITRAAAGAAAKSKEAGAKWRDQRDRALAQQNLYVDTDYLRWRDIEGKKYAQADRLQTLQGLNPKSRKALRGTIKDIEAANVTEKAKNPYAIGMERAMKSKGDKPPLEKSTITKAHDIAKAIKKKTDEAQIPNSGPDYGAGLGAGRSQETFEGKKKQKVEEAMNTLEAAYHEGKSHGLTKHGYACRYDEGTEEHRRYHDGFKEGLDECYGLMPNRGLVGETMPAATVPGMADQAAGLGEMDKTAYMQHKAKTTPGDTFKAFGQTMHDKDVLEMDEFAFESLDKQLNDLLNEGLSVNMSQGLNDSTGGQGTDTVSVTATDDDAAKLLDFIKQVGLGGLGGDKAEANHGEVVAQVSDYGAPKFSGHDDMMGLMKVVSGDDYKDEEHHEKDHSGETEGTCNECGGMMEAGHTCGEGKEMVDEVESEDQMEYEVAEDNAGKDEEEMTTADEKTGAEEDLTKPASGGAVTEGGDGGEASEEPEMTEAAEDNPVIPEEELTEWANDAGKDGTQQTFERDIDFMTKVISGGLNKPKSTGQQTVPVLAGDKARTGIDDELIAEWKKLSGLR